MWSSSSTFASLRSYIDSTLSFCSILYCLQFQRCKYKKYFKHSITFPHFFCDGNTFSYSKGHFSLLTSLLTIELFNLLKQPFPSHLYRFPVFGIPDKDSFPEQQVFGYKSPISGIVGCRDIVPCHIIIVLGKLILPGRLSVQICRIIQIVFGRKS